MCGSTSGQRSVAQGQTNLFNTLTNQAKTEFGDSSAVFQDLNNTFAPIVAAGPNQQGFSAVEDAALKSAAITSTGEAYRHAAQAVKENNAAIGGGNAVLPGGSEINAETAVANQGAEKTAEALNKIDVANYETGRQNYFAAASGLAGAPGVFGTSNSAGGVATGAGEAAAQTENQIAQENNSWVNAVTGALGGIAGSAVTGELNLLSKKSPASQQT